jgi:hypothetical protein
MPKINLADEISKALTEYTTEVTEGLEEAKLEVAKETVVQLKKTSPENTGSYKKGWSKKKVGSAQVVYNRTDYQKTHLLEKGHAKRGGGRVRAYPHIGPAEEKAIDEYLKRAEKVIEG